MKKKIFYILLSLAVLFCVIIASLPFLIESEKIQQQILQRIEQCYLVDASVNNVKVSFFPLPHIDLSTVKLKDDKFTLFIPEIRLWPSWKIIIGQAEVGRVNLTNPQFTLLQDFWNQDEPESSSFVFPQHIPGMSIIIIDGTITLPQLNTDFGIVNTTTFSMINSTLAIEDNSMNLEWYSRLSFGEDITLNAFISLADLTGSGDISTNHLDLGAVFQASPHSLFALISDTSDFTSSFTYSPEKGLLFQFDGDIPDFTLTGPDLGNKPPVPIRAHEGKLDIFFNKNTFEINIQSLNLVEPRAQIQGNCSYYLPENGTEKHVKLDLQGQDIDATSVRRKLLDLVGSNFVAKTVCEIVQSGHASSASYYFDDTIPAFENINTMTIDVDVERADIHLKYVPIDLHNAKGKIRIKDGDLTGWDITTTVGDSKGKNGSFLVGLGSENWGLTVDVDIDADLQDLPQVLRDIIPDKDVVEELHLLTSRGRADGHLHIGDDLRDFKVRVDVQSFNNSEIRYDRLSWPVSPIKGQLQVTDSGANWTDLSLNIGNHIIRKTTGSIKWTDPLIPFELTSLSGIFDNNTILAELKSYDTLKEPLDSVITSMIGSTQLVGSIKGNLFDPSGYVYNFDTNIKDIIIKSPYFPESISLTTAHARITDSTIAIKETTGMLFGDSLHIDGNLAHDTWMNWSGNLTFNGELKQPLLNWVKMKGLLSNMLQINTPSVMDNMQVKWQDHDFLVQGALQPNGTTSRLQMKFNKTNEIMAGDFKITHKEQTCRIKFINESLNNSWDFFIDGTLPGQALMDIFVDPFIQFNTITGKMDIHARFPTEETPPDFTFSGNLLLTRLNLLVDQQRSPKHTISFSVTGHDQILSIHNFDINYNTDFLHSKGQFQSEGWDGYLNLELQSPSINTETVEEITDTLDIFLYDRLGIPRNTTKNPSKYNLHADIDFNFAHFTVPFGEKNVMEQDVNKYQFPVTPLQGQYTIDNISSSLQVDDSMVCGLEVAALLTWSGEKETSKSVSIQTPGDSTVELRDFLECFNSNAVIEGQMTFKAGVKTKQGAVETGHFILNSKNGHIYKFVAVAKAISILNIKGWSGSIWQKGFYYNEIELSGTVENDILQISKFFIDGDGVDLVGKGSFDIDRMEYDMVFYVVPFASINSIVTNVPIVGRLLGGKEGRIVSVPVKITGSAIDPDVSVMDTGEIGESTKKWIWDTITIPFDWQSTSKPPEKSSDQQQNQKEQVPALQDK
jgi:hypothetical protein